jgi:putative ABC transport system permease protein
VTKVALKGMATRRLRTALTALAIVLGVAMISGAFILTDTMRNAADSLSDASYSGTDAVVAARTEFEAGFDSDVERPTVPAATLESVRRNPDVEVAVGDVLDEAKLVDPKGETIGDGPYFGVGFDSGTPGSERVSPFRLRQGRWATGPDQVVLDQGTAENEDFAVGDRVRVATRGPARTFEVVGLATFGDVDSIGTATAAVFDLRTAQDLFRKQGSYDSILARGRPGVPPAELRRELSAALPDSLKVETAAQNDRFDLDGLKEFLSWIRGFLLAFAGVALFVGAFTIFNTLSITVAQRSRELAMLRTVGASRRQVLRSVLVEAFAIGLGASLVGLVAGFGLAELLNSVFRSIGLDLPQADTVFATRTVIVSLVVGTIVTLLAGLGPALRATRVSPVTALREGAEIPPSRIGRRAPQIAIALLVLAVGLLAWGMFGSGLAVGSALGLMGAGCVLLFIGVALISPRFVLPLASVLGRPAERIGGSAGRLARRNAMRNPGRTAVTASALMIGIALVAFVAVLGAGMRASTSGALEDQLQADFVLSGQDGWSPIDPEAAATAARQPGVRVATAVRQDEGRAFGEKALVDAVDPIRIGQVMRFEWEDGSDAAIPQLAGDGAIVHKDYAEDHDLGVGDRVTVTSISGRRLTATVAGIDDPPPFNPLGLGDITVGNAAFDRAFEAQRDRLALIAADDTARLDVLEANLAGFPDAQVETAAQFRETQSEWVDQLLAIFYVLLGLAVIVSLFGIVNTLVLSLVERTREIGMLRAVGMTRRQTRRMVRHESVITALIGAALGVVVGIFLAALVTTALSAEGLEFEVPVGSLLAFTIVAIVAGMLAAILPARRAARMDVLSALQYE